MDKQYSLFSDTENKEKNKFAIGHGLILELRERYPQSALLFVQGVMVKKVNLTDKIRKKCLSSRLLSWVLKNHVWLRL